MPFHQAELHPERQDPHYIDIRASEVGFPPAQVIFRKLIINEANTDLSVYEHSYVPLRYRGPSWFKTLLRRIALEGYPPDDTPDDTMEPETMPLDIPVYRNTIIVAQLPSDGLRWFERPGVELKKTSSGDYPVGYGQLRWVDRLGAAHVQSIPDCRMIYFRAVERRGTDDDPHIQSFHYIINKLKRRFTPVDPDIRHPGNGDADPQ
jgi:hypothetical protein